MVEDFSEFIKQHYLFSASDHLLIAVSGGVDSIVLTHLCHLAGYNFSIAHCNFNLRGEESREDQAFIEKLAEKYKVPVFIQSFDTLEYSKDKKLSIQEAARELRYAWFAEIISTETNACKFLVTAHHGDDNVETILMNVFKGTGISGLRGILPKHGFTCRPLLFASKKAIYAFAQTESLTFREDSSNTSGKYTRNVVRNEIIPLIEKTFPAVKQNMMHNAERFRDIEVLYEQSLAFEFKKLFFKTGNEIHIPALKLFKHPLASTLIFELMQPYGFTASQVKEILKLLNSESGKYVDSKTHRVLKNRKWLIISGKESPANDIFLITDANRTIEFKCGKLKIESTAPEEISDDPYIVQLDMKEIKFPLLLRKWKQGDYFYPLGMQKKKKLSRFFIDKKLSLTQKENTWVLESDKRVLWVVGHRIDDRFKMNKNTREVLKVSLISED